MEWITRTVRIITLLSFYAYTITDASVLVAIKFDRGIVVGSDTRTVLSSGSSYVNHPNNMYQVIPINSNVVLARSGSGDDAYTQYIVQQVRYIQHMQFIQYNRILSVSQIAHYVRNMVYQDDTGTNQMELLVVGMNPNTCTHEIYTITASGAIIGLPDHVPFATAGSGSSYITGYLQEELCSSRRGCSDSATSTAISNSDATSKIIQEDTAIQLCHRAIQMAIQNDPLSGSGKKMCLYVVKRNDNIASDPSDDDQSERIENCFTCYVREHTIRPSKKKEILESKEATTPSMSTLTNNNNGFAPSIPYIRR